MLDGLVDLARHLAPGDATELGRSAAATIADQVEQQSESRQGGEREAVEAAVASVKEHIKIVERDLNFQVDEITGRTVVQVFDSETEQLIRQIPPEEVIAVAHALRELQDNLTTGQDAVGVLTGLLVREQA